MISSDFDFEIGDWLVRHRRLKDRLVGSQDWEEFDGRSTTRHVLGGNGNVEDNIIDFPSGTYRAIAIRSFDEKARSWAIWWLSSNSPHQLDVPVIGSFENDVGTFLAADSLNGQPILVRFLWLSTDTATPRWEQAMSPDEAKTWETNGTMDFRRP